MNTLIIVGVIAFGLGLVVFAAVGVLIFLRPQRRKSAPKPPRAPAQPTGEGEASADDEMNPVSLSGGPPSMPPTPEEDDPHGHINTGILNIRDFDNFEELIAAAETLTKGKKEE